MSMFTWDPPGLGVSDPFGHIVPREVLYEFDGPRLFTFATQAGLFLAYLCDETQGSFRHIVVPTSDKMVHQLKEGSCPVRAALVQEASAWIADMDGVGQFKNVWNVGRLGDVLRNLPDDVLPVEGVTLYPDSDEMQNESSSEILYGNERGLRIWLRWRGFAENAAEAGGDAGVAELLLWVEKTLAWGAYDGVVPHPLRFDAVHLLHFLGDIWPKLLHQENVDHDLAGGLDGSRMNSVILVKKGCVLAVRSQGYQAFWNHGETVATLEAFGDGLAERMRASSDWRVHDVLTEWDSRHERADQQYRVLSSGLNTGRIARVWPYAGIVASGGMEAQFCMAARMVGGLLNDEQLSYLLKRIAQIGQAGPKTIRKITSVRKRLQRDVAFQTDDFRQQGMDAANALRNYLKVPQHERVGLEEVLKGWGLELEEYNSGCGVDAVSVWGKKIGPAVLLNLSGPRSALPRGRRFTLAHELAHLLIDVDGFRPVGDVFVPRAYEFPGEREGAEVRANAFAAEFLLPIAAVQEFLRVFDRENTIHNWKNDDGEKQRLHSQIADHFDVSYELAAWKIKHTDFFDDEQVVCLDRTLNSVNFPYC